MGVVCVGVGVGVGVWNGTCLTIVEMRMAMICCLFAEMGHLLAPPHTT